MYTYICIRTYICISTSLFLDFSSVNIFLAYIFMCVFIIRTNVSMCISVRRVTYLLASRSGEEGTSVSVGTWAPMSSFSSASH